MATLAELTRIAAGGVTPGERVEIHPHASNTGRGHGTTLRSTFSSEVWINVRWDDGTTSVERRDNLRRLAR